MADVTTASYSELVHRIIEMVRERSKNPCLIGISGPPATGKSTLAERLAKDLSTIHGLCAQFCPMDGFHLSNAELEARGLAPVKGRIDTYDVKALLAALARIKAKSTFWWPVYSRELHDPVAEGVRIFGGEDVFLIEGNYLFCDAPIWRDVAALLDLRIFIDAPDEVLRPRLFARHLASGRSIAEANAKIARTDLPNAAAIREGKRAAEIVLDGNNLERIDYLPSNHENTSLSSVPISKAESGV